MEVRCASCAAFRMADKSVLEHRMTFHPFGAVLPPVCGNNALQKTVEVHGKPNNWARAESVTSNLDAEDCPNSFDEGDTDKYM